jgi:hypothetical protein
MEMLRLDKVAIARRIPHREAHPFLARDVEGDAEFLRAEGCQVRGGKNLSVGRPSRLPKPVQRIPMGRSALLQRYLFLLGSS